MAWNNPRTWTAARLLSSQLNEQLRDNMNYLKSAIDGALKITARQGGSATDWDTYGTTNYALSANSIIQVGVALITVSSSSQGHTDITYPSAFAGKPLVLLGLLGSPASNAFYDLEPLSRTASGFTAYINYASSVSGSVAVAWIAIGPTA